MGKIRDIDYVGFCGGPRPDWETRGLIDSGGDTRIRAEVSRNFEIVNGLTDILYDIKGLRNALDSNRTVQIIDVRPTTEFGICRLPGSISKSMCNRTTFSVALIIQQTYLSTS